LKRINFIQTLFLFIRYSSLKQNVNQERIRMLPPENTPINQTPRSVAVDKNFRITQAHNLYELALNFSYFVYYNSGNKYNYLSHNDNIK